MGPTRAPLGYLLTASGAALESFELSRLNRASNLRGELRDVVENWIETEVDARLARCILEVKRRQASRTSASAPELEGLALSLEKPSFDIEEPAPHEQLALPFAESIDAAAAAETPQAALPRVAHEQLLQTTAQTELWRAETTGTEDVPPPIESKLAKPRIRRPAAGPVPQKIAGQIAEAAGALPVAPQPPAFPYKSLGSEDDTARRELECFARRNRPDLCDARHPSTVWRESLRPREAAARDTGKLLSIRSEFVTDPGSDDPGPVCGVSRRERARPEVRCQPGVRTVDSPSQRRRLAGCGNSRSRES